VIIYLYLLKRFLHGLFISLVVLISIEIFFSFTAELKYLDEGDYDLMSIVEYIILSIPRSIQIMFPYAVLIGTLLSLGSMASDMEFVAMQSAGMSVKKIIYIVLFQVFIISSLFYIITDFTVPRFSSIAEKERNLALKRQTIYQKNGIWFKNGNSFIKINEIYPDNSIRGITVYDYDNNELSFVRYIQSAKFLQDKWELVDVLSIDLTKKPISKSRKSREISDNLIDINLLSIKTDKSYSLRFKDVKKNIEYLSVNNLDASIQKKIYWDKLLKPISTVIMLFLAMPFIFGRMRATNASKRIVIGLFIGISFFIASSILPNLGILIGLNPFINAILPLIIFLYLGKFIFDFQVESGLR
tara:strand:+ start:266 stop:1336 length:1071 start_codon:yes stop_codon:yes gene_type:complete